MEIRYLGHACFRVTAADGTSVIFDPYRPGGEMGYGPITDPADVVTVSHEHWDHNHPQGVPGEPQVISGFGVASVGGFTFRGIASKHDFSDGSQRGDNTIFCVGMDCVRLCHLGDLGHELSPAQLADIGHVDVLFLPVGGYYTIDAEAATRVMHSLTPRIAIPMHFRTDKFQSRIAPVDDFLMDKVNVTRTGRSDLDVTHDSLPQDPVIVVLTAAL